MVELAVLTFETLTRRFAYYLHQALSATPPPYWLSAVEWEAQTQRVEFVHLG
ncbi:MAG: hypothetical protein ACJ8BW_14220 [Ktedonobacteraceae bacterium]